MIEEDLSYKIRGAIYEVYNYLGIGLLESVYTNALKYELERRGLKVCKKVALPVLYKEITLDVAFRLDLLVEDKAIIEVKSVEELKPIHHKQLLNYLKITQLKLGILVNFNEENINNGIFRKINLT